MKGYRTLIFSGVVFLLGLVTSVTGVEFPEDSAEELTGGIMIAIGIISAVLRTLTDTPVPMLKGKR